MSRWRNGCDRRITVTVPRGHDFRTIEVHCGSTSYDGGVNQCAECAEKRPMPAGREDETDEEYDDRAGIY